MSIEKRLARLARSIDSVASVAPELIAVAEASSKGEHFGEVTMSDGVFCTCGTPAGECPGRVALAALERKLTALEMASS